MRKMTMITAAAALLGMAGTAQAQTPTPPPSIRVTGTAEVRAAPDRATVDFGVETTAPTAQAAATINAAQMQQVIQALVLAGVPRDSIETRDYNVFPEYDPRPMEPDSQPLVRGYRVTNTVSATLDSIAGVGSLIDAALGAGANRVHGVRFGLSNPHQYRAQAIQQATANAQADAQALATAMGVQLGMIREAATLELGYGGPQPVMLENAAMADMAQSAPTPISPGAQIVRARVMIVYTFFSSM